MVVVGGGVKDPSEEGPPAGRNSGQDRFERVKLLTYIDTGGERQSTNIQ